MTAFSRVTGSEALEALAAPAEVAAELILALSSGSSPTFRRQRRRAFQHDSLQGRHKWRLDMLHIPVM
jgi:hypothetical protein